MRWLEGHVKGITSIECVHFHLLCAERRLKTYSWSQNSRYVLTSSKDWNVIIWDLASDTDPPRRQATIRFDVPVVSASFHPKNRCAPFLLSQTCRNLIRVDSKIVLVLLSSGEAYLVDMRREYRGRYELSEVQYDSDDEAQSSRTRYVPYVIPFVNLAHAVP